MTHPDLINRIARIVNPTAWDDRYWGKPAGFKSHDRDQQRYAKDHARAKAREIAALMESLAIGPASAPPERRCHGNRNSYCKCGAATLCTGFGPLRTEP